MYYHSFGYGAWAFGWIFAVYLGALLFAFIAVCFVVALASYFICWSKKDWLCLALGLAFTLAADYFLILHDRHLIGVAVFCFAHVAYILRAITSKRGVMPRIYFMLPVCVLGLIVVVLACFRLDGIYVVTVLYAGLFIVNIYVSARYIQRNRVLVIAGLLLFAACDICVMLFNLPLHTGAPDWFRLIFPMIWVFYLPSQALLAVSAVDFTRSLSSKSSTL